MRAMSNTTSKKTKSKANKSTKSRKRGRGIHSIHNGSGEFKFTQINDYL